MAAGRRDRPEQQARRQSRRARQGIRRRLEAQRQWQGHHADAAQSYHRRQRHPLRFCQCRHRSRRADRDHFDQGAGGGPARRYRRPDRAGRVVLAAAGGARARRRDPASAHQRTRNRDAAVQVAWRCRQCRGLRRLPRSQQGALAGQRDQALLEAGAEAHRRHLAHAGDAGRARLLLRRHARRTRVRRRPLLHADRLAPGRQPRPPGDRADRDEFRSLSDEPRPDAAAIALPGRSGRSGARGGHHRHDARCRRGRRTRPRHLRARRHRLGRRGAGVPGGTHVLLARRPHRHGSEFALRRARDHGIENLLAPHGVAELDLPAPQRGRRRRRAAPLRHRPEGAVRYDAGLRRSTP